MNDGLQLLLYIHVFACTVSSYAADGQPDDYLTRVALQTQCEVEFDSRMVAYWSEEAMNAAKEEACKHLY